MAAIQLGVASLAVILTLMNSVQAVSSGCLEPSRNLTVFEIKSRSLSISWTKPNNTDNINITYDVFYKAKGSSWKQLSNVKDTKANLTVKPYRTYQIFVMTKANGIPGVASVPVYNKTTLPEVPGSCPEVTHEFEREADPHSLGILWKDIPQEDWNGQLVSYVIMYKNCSMVNEENITVTVAEMNHPCHEAKCFHKVHHLGPGPYMVRVAIKNTVGFCKDYLSVMAVSENDFPKKKGLICPTSSPGSTVSPSSQVTPSPSSMPPQTSSVVQPSQSPSTTPAASTPVATPPVTQAPITQAPPKTTQESQQTKEPCPTSTKTPCTCPNTKEPDSDTEKPAEKLANTDGNDWLKYVAIALAVIVVIMGITIFLLIWQLYKNHRFYRLSRNQAYKMTTHDQAGRDNQGQDNP